MNENLRAIISNSISGGLTAFLPIIFRTPESAVFAATLQPFFSTAIDSIFSDLASERLSKNECKRLGFSYLKIVEKVNKNVSNGLDTRSDDFFEKNDFYSKADEIIESTVKKILNDTNYKKASYYANFIGNIGFSKYQIDQDYARFLMRTLESLSYRQLCLLRYYRVNTHLDVSRWANYFERNSVNAQGLDLYTEILQLKNLNLIKRNGAVSLGVDLQDSVLNRSGAILHDILELDEISTADLDSITNAINGINNAANSSN